MLIELMLSATMVTDQPPDETPNLPTADRTPAQATLSRLSDDLERRPIRVHTPGGVFELTKPRFDSAGVWSDAKGDYEPARQALVQTASADPPVPPHPITWSEVDSIATGPTRTVDGALVGALFGAGLGIGAGYLVAGATKEEGALLIGGMIAALGAATFGTVGAVVGGQTRDWETIYRASP